MKKFILTLILLIGIYFSIGFYVVQPIGAVPDGLTVVYFRLGTNLPFITSADGFILDQEMDVTLFGRLGAMAAIMGVIQDRILIRLPYSETLYLISTGGVVLEN